MSAKPAWRNEVIQGRLDTASAQTRLEMESDSHNALILAAANLILVLAYGFFVLAFHAIARSRSGRGEEQIPAGVSGAKAAVRILDRAEHYLYIAQIGAYLCALTLMAVFGHSLAAIPYWRASGWFSGLGIIDRWMGLILLVVVAAFAALVYVQVLKAVAYHGPVRTLCRLAPALDVCSRIFDPIARLLRAVLRCGLKPMGLSLPLEREEPASPEEISEMVEESSEAGKLEENEGEMIQGVIQFSDLVVREVMTPRADVVAVQEGAPLREIVDILVREGFSRILVVGMGLDDVKGVLVSKDLLPWVGKGDEGFALKKIMREVYSVPNTKRVRELLQEFRRTGIHLAVVSDEHGGVDGVVTIEDLIEEIVGEIFDEYDSPEEEACIRRTSSGDLLVSGGALIDELNTLHAMGIPPGGYDTIAGFVIHLLGHIPAVGETLEYNGHRIRIERAQQNRIVRLRIARDK